MFSIGSDGEFTPLFETPYPLEADLQASIATHPALLAGEQMDVVAPRHFMLVTAEAGIPVADLAGDRLSLDLLFLDQDAVPTLVEVKRSSDSRIRREVIGQILEYAATVCAFWSVDRFRAEIEKAAAAGSIGLALHLESTLSVKEEDQEDYWEMLRFNLERQRLRLILVADKVPPETLRIIEFLNRQMGGTEVYAVAVTQFSNGSVTTLTSRVLNPSLSESDRKSTSQRGMPWNRQRFYDSLAAAQPAAAVEIIHAIDDWAESMPQVDASFGSGKQNGSIQLVFHSVAGASGYRSGRDVVFLTLWTSGTVEVEFQYLSKFRAFKDISIRERLLYKLNEIGCELPPELDKRPNIPWSVLNEDDRLVRFLEVQSWVLRVAADGISATEV